MTMGWIFSWFALLLSIPAVQITTCTMGSENAWLTSLVVFTPVSLLHLGIIWLATQHHAAAAPLSIPLVVILPYRVWFAVRFLRGTTLQGDHLGSVLTGETGFNSDPSSWWAPWWAPLQLLIVAGYSWLLFSSWSKRLHRKRAG